MLYDKEMPSLKDKIIAEAEELDKKSGGDGRTSGKKKKIKKIKKVKKYETKKK